MRFINNCTCFIEFRRSAAAPREAGPARRSGVVARWIATHRSLFGAQRHTTAPTASGATAAAQCVAVLQSGCIRLSLIDLAHRGLFQTKTWPPP